MVFRIEVRTQDVMGIRVLRNIFGHKREEVIGEWTILHNEEGGLYDLYCSPNIIRVIKSRIMRWMGQVARMGKRGGSLGFW